jgi:hypothetical protein
MKETSSSVTILHDTQEWTTRFENLKDIRVDGEQIMQIHDLASNVTRQNLQIRLMATVCTILCVGAVGMALFVTSWLLSHESAIERVLLTGNRDFDLMENQAREWRSHKRQRAWVHLEHHQGLYWDEGMQDWILPYSREN